MKCVCGDTFTLIGDSILECLSCFSRNMADHNVSTLVLAAALGVMREPITRRPGPRVEVGRV